MARETAAERKEREEREAALNPIPTDGEEDHTEEGGKFIKFTGHSGVRSISADEWGAVGVKDVEDTVWDRTNAHRIPRTDFNDKQLNYLLNVDGEFIAED